MSTEDLGNHGYYCKKWLETCIGFLDNRIEPLKDLAKFLLPLTDLDFFFKILNEQ